MTKQEALDKLSERGFSVNAYGNDSQGNTKTIYASTNPLEEFSYSCDVILESEEFMFKYMAPESINVLQTPKCGSFLNDDHFNRLRKKFEPQARVLHDAFGKKETT